jgi:hypothetical protein
MVITGGDIARYERLLGESPLAPAQDKPADPRTPGRD